MKIEERLIPKVVAYLICSAAHWANLGGHMDIFIIIDNFLSISKMVHYLVCIITQYKVFSVE